MKPFGRQRRARAGWTTLALTFLLVTGGGGASAGPPNAATGALERATALVNAREFAKAVEILRDLVAADPRNRAARELLGFALESVGDVEGERRVRSALAKDFPKDPRIQADHGRVLERSRDASGALRAYRRARALSARGSVADLDAAIERMRGRTAVEVAAPVGVLSDPEATASSAQAGAAVPLGVRHQLTILARRHSAESRPGADAVESATFAASVGRAAGADASWTAGPQLHVVAPRGGGPRDFGVGGAIEGRVALAPLAPNVEFTGKVGVGTPWEEAALTILYGGRSTAAEGHLYFHALDRRLILVSGALGRQLSILTSDGSTRRADAWQSLWLAGVDAVVWRDPGASLRGEMLDESLIAPSSLSSALTLSYRHYDVTSRSTTEFARRIGLAPRGSVDEASINAALASPGGRLGLEFRVGLGRDAERDARLWRAGGAVKWAAWPAGRLTLEYERASEFAAGLTGERRAGRVSLHADL